MIDLDESGECVLMVRSDTDFRQADEVRLELRCPREPYGDEYVTEFLVRACGDSVRIEAAVRILDGDGLVEFLDDLAEGFSGWDGTRTWRAIDRGLTLSAEHRGHVHLRWGLVRHGLPGLEPARMWLFETTTAHAAGESMRTLAADVRAFLDAAM
ncbi:DUF6228 family protein [Nocardia grenadensis]|uniref:DUF6228 family protein n=1 Tax=Nocardia grenadensis TaxID=931537 RepID=UPI003D9462E3